MARKSSGNVELGENLTTAEDFCSAWDWIDVEVGGEVIGEFCWLGEDEEDNADDEWSASRANWSLSIWFSLLSSSYFCLIFCSSFTNSTAHHTPPITIEDAHVYCWSWSSDLGYEQELYGSPRLSPRGCKSSRPVLYSNLTCLRFSQALRIDAKVSKPSNRTCWLAGLWKKKWLIYQWTLSPSPPLRFIIIPECWVEKRNWVKWGKNSVLLR